MSNLRLFRERRERHPSSKKVRDKVTLWEQKFREAKTPTARYWAMGQLRRWTEAHPLIQMWEERDPRFADMTWSFPS